MRRLCCGFQQCLSREGKSLLFHRQGCPRLSDFTNSCLARDPHLPGEEDFSTSRFIKEAAGSLTLRAVELSWRIGRLLDLTRVALVRNYSS